MHNFDGIYFAMLSRCVATRIPVVPVQRHSRSIARSSSKRPTTAQLLQTTAYRVYFQGVAGLAFLGLVDAAYSGDWGRIHVLTEAQELQLQQLVNALAVIHASCAVVIIALLKRPALALKALFTGPLALAEALTSTQNQP